MNDIFYKKLSVLKQIMNSYDLYKGGLCSDLEKIIYKLKSTLKDDDYKELLSAYNRYIDYILGVFASSRLVKVDFRDDIPTIDYSALNDVFNDLED